jgi:hypothetical protein
MAIKSKFTNDQRMLTLRMHAEGYDVGQIDKLMREEHDVKVNKQAYYDAFKTKKWQPFIKQFREEYLAKVKSVPIANKRIRMDDLERERVRINKVIKDNPLKTRADKSLYLQCVSELRRLSNTAMEEMEKKPHLFQNVVLTQGDMSDDALHRRKQELIKKFRRNDGRGVIGAEPDSGGIESAAQE